MNVSNPNPGMAGRPLLLVTLVFLLLSCHDRSNEGVEAEPDQYTHSSHSRADVFVPDWKDSLATGFPILATGKWIDPDSVSKPRVTLAGKPEITPVPSPYYVHPAGHPTVVPVPKDLPNFTPGRNGVPFPKVVKAGRKTAAAGQPRPIPALAAEIKKSSIADFQHINVPQGMSNSAVHVMLEDRNGYIWIGTGSDGITRYDGSGFIHYTEKEGLLGSSVHSLFEDSNGNIWIGTDGKGLTRYDGRRFTHFTKKEGLSSNIIEAIIEDSKGNIWIGTGEKGVNKYDGNSFTHFTKKEGLSHDSIQTIIEDSQGNIWIGTNGGGVNKYDGKSFTHITRKEGLSHNSVQAIIEDSKGNLWFGTGHGVNRYDRQGMAHYSENEGLIHNDVLSILEDSKGNLWFGTDGGGASKFDGKNFFRYSEEEGLTNGPIYSIVEDHERQIWFGVLGDGIYRHTESSFTYHDYLGRPVMEDSKGNLWIDIPEGLAIYDQDQQTFTRYTMREGLLSPHITSIMEDSRGSIWIGTTGVGVSRFDLPKSEGMTGGRFTHFTREEGLVSNDFSCFMEDSRENIWIGTHDNGVCKYDGESFTHFTTQEGLIHNHVHGIEEDIQGNIWIGTGRIGISKYDGRTFTHYTKDEGFCSEEVNVMKKNSKGELLFGTKNGGLNIYDGQSISCIEKKDGLSNNIVWSVIEDKKGQYWVGTEQGLNLLIPKSVSSPGSSSSGDFQIISFGREDGIKFIGLGNGFLDRKNRIWWGTMMLDLNQFRLPEKAPQIQLDHIELKQKFVDFRRLSDKAYLHSLSLGENLPHTFDSIALFHNYPLNLKLPHQINHLTFHFSAIDWLSPHKISYRFMLEGLDTDWSPVTPDNTADYRNLHHGAYTFKVMAAGESMIWSEPFSYTFTIYPPWWHTWWAYSLYALLILGLILGVRQYELRRYMAQVEARRLKELDSVKTQLYTNITHEFRTPLTVISGMVDQLAVGRWQSAVDKEEKARVSNGLKIIDRNGRNLLRLVNQMLDLAKLESGNLPVNLIRADVATYLRYLVESFQSYVASKQIDLVFHQGIEQLVMDFDEEKLQSIVSNLLSNAIRFTPEGGKVKFRVEWGEWREGSPGMPSARRSTLHPPLIITVTDNGIGIPPEKLPHIFDRFYQVDDTHTGKGSGTGIGLTLTKELVGLLGGQIKVESILGKGSEFTVILPVSRNAPVGEVNLRDRLESYLVFEKREAEIAAEMAAADQEDQPLLLVIEDNPDVVTYIRACLQPYYRIETAENGAVGIEKALELVPDIIISDVMMPVKDGFEVCATLKHDERTSHIPIILLTAKADVDSRIEGLERGADAYLSKPFEKRELMVRLQQLIQLRRRLQERYAGGLIPEPSGDKGLQMEDAFLQKIRNLVEEHLDDADFGIPELCRALHLSRTQVHRKLKALTDRTTSRIIRSIRLQKAREMLQNSELTVAEVAYDTGFTDPNHFSRVFKEEFGLPPSALK